MIRGSPGPRFVHLIVCRWGVLGPHVVNLMLLVAGSYGPQFAKLILAAFWGQSRTTESRPPVFPRQGFGVVILVGYVFQISQTSF